MMEALRAVLDGHEPGRLPESARLLVRGLIAAYRVDAALHHVLCQEVPKVGELTKVYSFEQQLAPICRHYLFAVDQHIRCKDIDRAIFMLVNAVPSVVRASVQADPGAVSDDRLVHELTDLILRYVMSNPPD
jgi:hypothetical protein